MSFAFPNLWAKRLPAGRAPWTVLVYSVTAGVLFWLSLAPPWGVFLAYQPPAVWLGIGVVTVFGSLLPFPRYFAALARISAAAHASVTYHARADRLRGRRLRGAGGDPGLASAGGGALVLAGIAVLHVRR